MNEKLSFQNITEALAQKAGVQKKVSETFTKAFFDTIVEALYMGEDTIKVKGLGTFKLVEVGSRESVNVSNGERIVIPGYKKVSFTPEDSVVEFLNPKGAVEEQLIDDEPEPVAEVGESRETLPLSEIIETSNEVEDATNDSDEVLLDDLLQSVAPECVEIPQDEFSGIDMLISTPESVDEVRQQLADATVEVDEAVEVARKAIENKLRLQKLLERLEANSIPEIVDTGYIEEKETLSEIDDNALYEAPSVPETNENDEAVNMPSHNSTERDATTSEKNIISSQGSANADEEDKKNRAFERYMQTPNGDERKDSKVKKKRTGVAWFVSISVILLAVIIFFLYKTFISIDAVKEITPIHEASKPKVERSKKDSTVSSVNKIDSIQDIETTKDTSNVSPQTAEISQQPSVSTADATSSRPSFYVMKKGESLTRIAQRFYGTKDSVRAIIRANDFIDPNNVPIGAKIKLP